MTHDNNISELGDSVIKSTADRPVVPDTSFSPRKPCEINLCKAYINNVSAQSCSKYLPCSVMCAYPLWSSYARDIPTHPNKDFDLLCHLDATVMTILQFYAFEYIQWYMTCFDVVSFQSI